MSFFVSLLNNVSRSTATFHVQDNFPDLRISFHRFCSMLASRRLTQFSKVWIALQPRAYNLSQPILRCLIFTNHPHHPRIIKSTTWLSNYGVWNLERGGEDNWGQSRGHVGESRRSPSNHLWTALPLCRRALIEISC